MSSISSLTKAVSGLNAAQKGLQVTGHNISNTNTKGYTRQQLLQSESSYVTIGNSGGNALKVGLGVTCDEIRQIRDDLADRRLRTETSVLNYYQQLNSVTQDIESIFDEPYGNTISDLMNTFWAQTQTLSQNVSGITERTQFISTAQVLINKINVVSDSLTDYQMQLNKEVERAVNRINELIDGIKACNDKVAIEKATGENANDYRDERNLLLDELATYGNISYYEGADRRVTVSFEGHTVVDKDITIKMKLKQTEEGSPFDSPVWVDTGSSVYDLDDVSSAAYANDTGSLQALLIARGNNVVNKDTTWKDVALNDNFSVDVQGNAFIVPKIQKLLGDFTSKLVNTVNNTLTGTGIGEWRGKQGLNVFVEINAGRGLVPGNIQVNPELLEGGGYNKLGTINGNPNAPTDHTNNNDQDTTLVTKLLAEMGTSHSWYSNSTLASAPYKKTSSMKDFFSELVTDIGGMGSLYTAKATEKSISTTNIQNERLAMSGVSTDEEFSSMLKYQYAYNASARMITMLDGMMDTIINKM